MSKWKALIMGNGKNQGKKNVIWNMTGSLLFALSSILLFAVAARATGEYYGGIFSIAFTTGQMLLTIGYYEVRPFHVTDVSRQYSFPEYLSARMITSAAMAAAGFVYVFVSRPSAVKAAVILLMCFYKLMDGVADVFEGEFHRQGRLDIAGKSMAFRTAFSGGVFILVVILSKDIVVASAAAVAAAVFAFAVFDLVMIGEFEPLRLSRAWGRVYHLLRDCFFLFIGSFLYLYICNAAKYAIDAHMTEEAVTYYTDIYLPTSTINLLSGFMFKPLLTTMGNSYEAGEWKKFKQIVNKLLLGIVALTAICCLGAFLLGIPVLSLIFGHDLTPYRGALVILILGGGFNAAVMLLYYALTTMRRQTQILICYGTAFILAAIAAPVLVKRLGIMGGAVCYTLVMGALAVLFLGNVWFQYRKASSLSGGEI
ncbi:lipopolysaccharide biosynthesis protein [Qiania dongpingensis]|uniref:Lipopolysaccharide biosynthesis protein n=1 Tax=Qiania dongpingensis TaxID=2763669 RepID=A0A7G9G7U7_9FIRM|nr:lipopolysaccharide biosynthesis protein [Qiania dongpingensis]QNM06879.1 lipopolysaccharide biosynthesis protein [Qiania dongpingensis]